MNYLTDVSSFISGCVSGITQTVVGHPFDTIKTHIQSKSRINHMNYMNPFFLYKGFSYPLLMSMVLNSLTFGVYENIHLKLNSSFISGAFTGLILGPFITPFENLKIHSQIGLKRVGHEWIYKGIGLTTMRESLALSIYFSSYDISKEYTGSSFLSGCISGVSNWLITYPLDTVKTRIQNYQYVSIKDAVNAGNLMKGLPIVLVRASLVNGAIFYTYDTSMSYIHDTSMNYIHDK